MEFMDFNTCIKKRRLELKLPFRKVAAYIDIDQSTLSKIERGERIIQFELLKPLSEILLLDLEELKRIYLSEKVLSILYSYDDALEILKVAEEKIKYRKI